jgi:hypothetical protein
MNQFVKQAQALQANMQKAQAEIANLEVTGESGGGMVKVVMSGRHEVKRVQIEPSVIGDDAVHRLESASQAKLSAAMGGLSLPPGVKLPF